MVGRVCMGTAHKRKEGVTLCVCARARVCVRARTRALMFVRSHVLMEELGVLRSHGLSPKIKMGLECSSMVRPLLYHP